MSLLGSKPKYVDGYYGTPQRVSRTPRRYPFAGNGDIATAEYDAVYLVAQGAFGPTARGTLDPEARSVAVVFANTTFDTISCATAHGFSTGQCLHLTITSGLTGLSTGKAYFAIVTGTTTLKLATDSVNAAAGTGVDITADGTGTLQEGFYLIDETKPEIDQGDLATFRRTYSSIPQQQIVPGSTFVTKPDLPGVFPQVSGSSLIIQPEENVPRWVFYTQKPVTSDSGVPTGQSPTGGTFTTTITIGASSNTTAGLAYNLSAATFQSALNALAVMTLYGAVATVTGSYTAGFVVSITYGSLPTVDTSGLTGAGYSIYTYVGASTSVIQTYVGRFIFKITALGGGGAQPPPNSASFTGGGFTINIFGQTTASIPYNGTITDVQTAVLALSNVPAGTVVQHGGGAGYLAPGILRAYGAYNDDEIFFVVVVPIGSVAVNGASLTPSGSTAVATPVSTPVGTWQTRVTFTGVNLGQRILFSAAHGISAIDGIVVTQGANYHTIPAGLYAVTTDTITLSAASGVAFTTPTLITVVGSSTGSEYTGGSKLTAVKRVTDYYLPGKTPVVDTIDDIPLPTYEGDDVALLVAIFDGDTDINYRVGEREYYRDGPIIQQTRTTLNASQL